MLVNYRISPSAISIAYLKLSDYLVTSDRDGLCRYVLENPFVKGLPQGDTTSADFEIYKENKVKFLIEVVNLIDKNDIRTLNYLVKNFYFSEKIQQHLLEKMITDASAEMVQEIVVPLIARVYPYGNFPFISQLLKRDREIIDIIVPAISKASAGLSAAKDVTELELLYYLHDSKHQNKSDAARADHFKVEAIAVFYQKLGNVPFSKWIDEYNFLCEIPEIKAGVKPFYLPYTLLKMALKKPNTEDVVQSIVIELVNTDENFDNSIKYLSKKHPEVKKIAERVHLHKNMESFMPVKTGGVKKTKL